ncbi:MAG: lytic transglycosylase domain-containing protein [Burkholderiales bacterium]
MFNIIKHLTIFVVLATAQAAYAGNQVQEMLSASVRSNLSRAVSDQGVTKSAFISLTEEHRWLDTMGSKLMKSFPVRAEREEFLRTVHYEATRAGLDPQMVLGLIQVESGFKKYAVSSASARGYMQVMPFWVKDIGTPDMSLFNLRTNLRFGCTIMRHYLDIERGNLFRALGRYNGSLGRPEYPNMVLAAWKRSWDIPISRTALNDTRSPG